MLYNRLVKCIMLVLSQTSFIEFIFQTNLLDVVWLSCLHCTICPKDLHQKHFPSPQRQIYGGVVVKSNTDHTYTVTYPVYTFLQCTDWDGICVKILSTLKFFTLFWRQVSYRAVVCAFLESNASWIPVRLGLTYLPLAAKCRF